MATSSFRSFLRETTRWKPVTRSSGLETRRSRSWPDRPWTSTSPLPVRQPSSDGAPKEMQSVLARDALKQRGAPLAVHAFAVLLCGMTFLLLIAGALVKSTGSGLAVPDWPLSYGKLMPPMVDGVFYEHGHRMVASTVGFLMTVL